MMERKYPTALRNYTGMTIYDICRKFCPIYGTSHEDSDNRKATVVNLRTILWTILDLGGLSKKSGDDFSTPGNLPRWNSDGVKNVFVCGLQFSTKKVWNFFDHQQCK